MVSNQLISCVQVINKEAEVSKTNNGAWLIHANDTQSNCHKSLEHEDLAVIIRHSKVISQLPSPNDVHISIQN